MTTDTSRPLGVALPLLVSAFLLLAGCGGSPTDPGAGSAEVGGEERPAPTAISDLDQPVESLLSARCEHQIPQYTCDECRYQVGVVKAPDDLFDAAKGGTLKAVKIGPGAVASGSDSNGEVRLNEEKSVYLSPRAPGVVQAIHVDLGARVSQGQVLFEVDSPGFRQAKADYVRASAALELARATEQRESDLYAKKICPRKDLLEAQAALRGAEAEQRAASGILAGMGLSPAALAGLSSGGDVSGFMPVRAPFAGTVLERALNLGGQVQPGDKVLLLADTSRMWILTTVYEGEVAGILQAQARGPLEAEVAVSAYPGRTFRGTVQRVGGTLDEATRATQARVVVDNPDNLLRAGMFARVRFLHAGASSLVLPDAAILEDEGRAFVFVHATGPYYIRRPVTVGRSADGWTEVSAGVKQGDLVVTQGAFLLKSDVLRSKMGAGCAD